MCQTFYVRAISPLNGTDPVSPAQGRWLPSLVYVYVAILIVKLIVTCSAAEAVYGFTWSAATTSSPLTRRAASTAQSTRLLLRHSKASEEDYRNKPTHRRCSLVQF